MDLTLECHAISFVKKSMEQFVTANKVTSCVPIAQYMEL